MKKLLSLILASCFHFYNGYSRFAETEETNSSTDATITFDTDKALDYVHTFGNASDTGLKTEISEKEVIWGRSLLMSEDFKEALATATADFTLTSLTSALQTSAAIPLLSTSMPQRKPQRLPTDLRYLPTATNGHPLPLPPAATAHGQQLP